MSETDNRYIGPSRGIKRPLIAVGVLAALSCSAYGSSSFLAGEAAGSLQLGVSHESRPEATGDFKKQDAGSSRPRPIKDKTPKLPSTITSVPAARLDHESEIIWLNASYHSHAGEDRPLIIVYPSAAKTGKIALSLVVSLHAKGGDEMSCARSWNKVPANYAVAVACPAGQGRASESASYAYEEHIKDMQDIPRLTKTLLMKADVTMRSDNTSIVGSSMGGMEALVAFSEDNNGTYKRVVAFDPVTNLFRRYYTAEKARRKVMLKEVGKQPTIAPERWLQRSPESKINKLRHEAGRYIYIICSSRDTVSCGNESQAKMYTKKVLNSGFPIHCTITNNEHGATWVTELPASLESAGVIGQTKVIDPKSCIVSA